MDIQIHEVHWFPNKFNPKRSSLRLSIFNNKGRILKAAKKKKNSHIQGNPQKATNSFLSIDLAGQREWNDISKWWKKKKSSNQEYFTQKSLLQKWSRDKDVPRKTKAEGVHHLPYKNAERSSSSWNKMTLISSLKWKYTTHC